MSASERRCVGFAAASENEEIDLLLSEYVDGELDAAGVARVEAHLAVCPACSSDLAFLRATNFVMARRTPDVFPPVALFDRIAQRTYARPTWKQRLVRVLSPAPVRIGVGTALAAGVLTAFVLPQLLRDHQSGVDAGKTSPDLATSQTEPAIANPSSSVPLARSEPAGSDIASTGNISHASAVLPRTVANGIAWLTRSNPSPATANAERQRHGAPASTQPSFGSDSRPSIAEVMPRVAELTRPKLLPPPHSLDVHGSGVLPPVHLPSEFRISRPEIAAVLPDRDMRPGTRAEEAAALAAAAARLSQPTNVEAHPGVTATTAAVGGKQPATAATDVADVPRKHHFNLLGTGLGFSMQAHSLSGVAPASRSTSGSLVSAPFPDDTDAKKDIKADEPVADPDKASAQTN